MSNFRKKTKRRQRRQNANAGIAALVSQGKLDGRVLREDEVETMVAAIRRRDRSKFGLARLAQIQVSRPYTLSSDDKALTLFEQAAESRSVDVALALLRAGAEPSALTLTIPGEITDAPPTVKTVVVHGGREGLSKCHALHAKFVLSFIFDRYRSRSSRQYSPSTPMMCEKCSSDVVHVEGRPFPYRCSQLSPCGHVICEACLWAAVAGTTSTLQITGACPKCSLRIPI